jgi:hypothetical protein
MREDITAVCGAAYARGATAAATNLNEFNIMGRMGLLG